MFSAGFAEATSDTTSIGKSPLGRQRSDSISLSVADGGGYEEEGVDDDNDNESYVDAPAFDDSDESGDEEDNHCPPPTPVASRHHQQLPTLYRNPRDSVSSFDTTYSSSTAVNLMIPARPDDGDRDSGASVVMNTSTQTPLGDEVLRNVEESQEEEHEHHEYNNNSNGGGGDSEEYASAGQNQTTDDGTSTFRNADMSHRDRAWTPHRAQGTVFFPCSRSDLTTSRLDRYL